MKTNECTACRKIKLDGRQYGNGGWKCTDCDNKPMYGKVVVLHYKDEPDREIDMFSKVVYRDSKMRRPVGFSLNGRIESAEEAEWLYKTVAMSLRPKGY